MSKKFLIFITIFVTSITAKAQLKELTNEHYFKGKWNSLLQPLPATEWINENILMVLKGADKILIDAKTGKELPLKKDIIAEKEIRYTPNIINKDNDIYLRDNNGEQKLTNDKAKEVNVLLSPDNNYVAYTKNNNLYIYNLSSKKENQITNDGSDLILNGFASWVYFEEILGRPSKYKSFWWGDDSKHIVFFRMDDTKVPLFRITDASTRNGKDESLHYPKVGDPSPEVKVGIVDIATLKTTWADFNEKDDQYFGKPYFTPDGKTLLVTWLNRDQNHYVIYNVDMNTGAKKEFYVEDQKTWISLDDDDRITFLKNTAAFLMLSDKTGFRNIYMHDNTGKQITNLTPGNYTVTSIEKIDEKNKVIYFIAKGKENTARNDFYKVNFDGKKLTRLSFGDFNHTIENQSPNNNYFVTSYSNSTTAPQKALVDNKGKLIKVLGNSGQGDITNYNIVKPTFIRVASEDGKYMLPMKVIYPLNFDKAKKYPVLISIYGGPDAGTCFDKWQLTANEQFYAKEGLMQVIMDHRASGHFGKEGVNFMHRNLGYWEIKDYSTMVQWLIDSAAADKTKIAITGFSYGGYMSCLALTYGADVFTHGMAGGSVTDWTLYDSHYTERYMDTDKDNPEGYKTSSVLNYADKLKGKLQIVHGEIDENVHLQNSMQLAKKLQAAKKEFDFMIYPGGRHGWSNLANQWAHYLNGKTNFIYKYLLEKEVPKEALK